MNLARVFRWAPGVLIGVVGMGALALSAGWVRGDTIITQNGRRYDGDLVSENASTVTLRVDVPGSSMSFTQQIAKSHIRSWDRAGRQGAPYVRIPIVGDIGVAVTGETVRNALAEAEQFKPKYVVLVIDSNGGRLDATFAILDELQDAERNFKIVACVKKAYSAGAMIAMSCPDIYMMPDSVMGAAVPMVLTRNGPKDIEAKFASAIEGKVRDYVVAAGHNDLIMRGMMEMNLPIYLSQKDDKPVLATSGPGMLLKPAGQILTLTPADAEKCGVAHIAADLADVGKQVTGGTWYECSEEPWDVAKSAAGAVGQQLDRGQMERMQNVAARQSAHAAAQEEINSIHEQMLGLASRISSDNQAINDAIVKCNNDCDQATADYHNAVAAAANDHNGAYEIAMAKESWHRRLTDARAARDSAITPLQADADATTAETNKLRRQVADLIAGVPTGE